MKILVLGNGFDLALGLPTAYKDFLNFLRAMFDFSKNYKEFDFHKELGKYGIDSRLKEVIIADAGCIKDNIFDYLDLFGSLETNFWFYYFVKKQSEMEQYNRIKWVDFEEEITNVGRDLTELVENKKNMLQEKIDKDIPDYVATYIKEYAHGLKYYQDVHDKLCEDLDLLKLLLNLYISRYVNRLEIGKLPQSFTNIFSGCDCVRVISFNYTRSAEKILNEYVGKENYSIDYIHGISKKDKQNGLVLGGDFATEQKCFSEFLKSSQRCQYQVDRKYFEWIEDINGNTNATSTNNVEKILFELHKNENEIVLFGHSLGVADRYILEKLLRLHEIPKKIFCYMKDGEDENNCIDKNGKIKNIQKIIGDEKLEEEIGNGKIEFCMI